MIIKNAGAGFASRFVGMEEDDEFLVLSLTNALDRQLGQVIGSPPPANQADFVGDQELYLLVDKIGIFGPELVHAAIVIEG